MDTSRWRRIRQIFETAVELDTGGRNGYLREATEGDEDLRREVVSLLAHAGPDDSLERSLVPRLRCSPSRSDEGRPVRSGDVEGAVLVELPPYSQLSVWTRRTHYELVLVAPLHGELTIHGGERFPQPTVAYSIKASINRRQPLTLGVDGRSVHTSRIERIALMPAGYSGPA